MRFAITTDEPVVFFRLLGSVAAGDNLDSLQTAVTTVSNPRIRAIVLDLAGASRLDCWGIGQLIRLRRLACQAGRTFGLVNVQERQRRLLDMAGLARLLGVSDTPDDARFSLGSSGPPTVRVIRQTPSRHVALQIARSNHDRRLAVLA